MKINLDTVADDAQIQIIPMIDVIFCILTFFILAALQLTRQQGINVDIPKAKTGVVQMRQMLVVSIDDSGQTFIDQTMIDRAQLYTLLKQYRDKNPEGLLVLNASQNAFYNDVIQVLDVLRSVGGDKVALATIPAPSLNPSDVLRKPSKSGFPTISPSLSPSGSGILKPGATGLNDSLLQSPTSTPLVSPLPFLPGSGLSPSPQISVTPLPSSSTETKKSGDAGSSNTTSVGPTNKPAQ